MFHLLPASDAHHDLRPRWVTTSIVAHALVIALALMATRGALVPTKVTTPEEPMLLFIRKASEPAGQRARLAPEIISEPPPEVLQPMPTPNEIPPAIPPIDLRRPFDPHDFAGVANEGGVSDSIGGSTGVRPHGIYEATNAFEGFEPAVLLSQNTPEYPAALLSAGLTGVVTLEFVIDTTGKVEAGSIRVIESSHPAFANAARAAVLGARFRPARLLRHPVRQITRQRVRFVASN
jgi:TonB family protein